VLLLQCYVRGNVARQKLSFLMYQQSASVIIQRAFRAHRQHPQAIASTQTNVDSLSAHNMYVTADCLRL